MIDDDRILFLVESICVVCRVSSSRKQVECDLSSSSEVKEFLDDSSCPALRASVLPSGETKVTTKLMTSNVSNAVDVIFIRRRFESITPKNIDKVLELHTMQGSTLEAFSGAVHALWHPALVQNTAWSDKLPPRILALVSELETSLSASSIRTTRELSNGTIEDINDVSRVIEPLDEISFWRRQREDRRSPHASLSRVVDQVLSKLTPLYECFEDSSLDGMGSILRNTLDACDAAWTGAANESCTFPQRRMERFFECVGSLLCRYLQKQLSGAELWNVQGCGDARIKLSQAIGLCEQWCNGCRELTDKQSQSNWQAWSGEIYSDSFVESFEIRLKQVASAMSLQRELTQLLTVDEKHAFQIDKIFKALENTKPLLYNPCTQSQSQWDRALAELNRALTPTDNAVVAHLRANLSSVLDRSSLLLAEFQKYKNLLTRPSIRKLLQSDRETLLLSMKELVRRVDEFVDKLEEDDNGNVCDADDNNNDCFESRACFRQLTRVADCIVQLRQLGAKVASTRAACEDILADVDGFDKFISTCRTLSNRIDSVGKSKFTSWLKDAQQRVEDDDPELRLQGSLLTWRDGILTVSYSDSLVLFSKEVRQLMDLGFDIPRTKGKRKGILEKALEAEKYYRYGVLLQKTASFYNSLSDQIIDIQEQLLLDSLTVFAGIVTKYSSKSGNDVSWGETAECENYINILQDAAEKLSNENRNLRKVHESLIDMTASLVSIDFLRQSEVWKQKWRLIKEKLTQVKNRYPAKDCRLWVLHWDHQIYKALEASYQMGLEVLNEGLPDIKIDLVFFNKQLEFKPCLEQVRQSYYAEIRKFVNMPNTFEGFGNSAVYKQMGPRNSKRLFQVYNKAEILFDKLDSIIVKYLPWVQLGSVDLDHFIDINVTHQEEYVTNFKILREKRKSMEKLPDFERIDCCLVSLTPFKLFLEDLFQRINDSLLISLRRSVLKDFRDIDIFLEKANEHLSTRPHTVEEISDSQQKWSEINSQKDAMKLLSCSCVEKKKLLGQFSPGSVVDITDVSNRMANLDGEGGRWDEFDIALEAFDDLVQEQKEVLKGSLDDDIIALNMSIEKFGSRWRQLKPSDSDIKSWDYSEIQRIFESLDDWRKQFNELNSRSVKLSETCATFSMSKPRFEGLDALNIDIDNTASAWDLLKQFYAEQNIISTQDWLSFSVNVYVLQDFATQWIEKLKANFAKGSNHAIAEHITSVTEKLKKSIPALKYCQGEPFKEDHWTELLHGKLQLSRDIRRENVKVEHFLSRLDILIEPSTLTFVKNLQSRALGEVQIREALQELKTWERTAEVTLLPAVESGRKIALIKDWKELLLEMSDKQALLASLKDNEYFRSFEDQGLALEAKMITLDSVIHTLNSIQRKWVYLEPIFGRGALPAEESRFRRIDEDFSDVMNSLGNDPRLFSLADDYVFPRLEMRLKDTLDQLDRCQKALTDFLEVKRNLMPRFYFIGDDDLLEILGQAKKPEVIQAHLKKLFQGINKVKFNQDCSLITAIISSSNEIVELDTPVPVNERVEDWLILLAQEMRTTLAASLKRCLALGKIDWSFPSQILGLSLMIKFTQEAEAAIKSGSSALEDLKKELQGTLRELTSGSSDLSSEPLLQIKIKSLVFDIVHNIDVLNQVQTSGTRDVGAWAWKKQLRYYIEGGNATVRMHDAKFLYTYEYQGTIAKLVHTPLTDKCYLTLTQGMHMGFGGNPYGPAGTGKTESVKALASCLGRQVLVFNCDEALESNSMIRIFIGIIKCGAFGCFDEFNRLREDQLSAISQQIQTIQDAIKMKVSPITLLGRSVDVNFNSGIFVTLNPAGKGYGGRSRLPNNLKSLFRPVAMGAPDNELIAEVSLVTEGFTLAKELASKIVSLFRLCKQLLSVQQHYDWGLRGLKAVLNSGGRIIQSYHHAGKLVDADTELRILIQALRVNTLSKLTYADTKKFLKLIQDVFPGVQSTDIDGGELEKAILEVMQQAPFNLVVDETQVKKIVQLKESLDQRIGCVIVGPSGSGKSSLWRVLKAAMIKCGQPVMAYVMNPKAMHRDRLLGRMDVDTREWSDGVLTDAARNVVKESSDVRCWIVCDGDIDPEWVESLNSVLDDNHLLTLPNGERISFGSNVNFLFETHDLKYASPATVSRMGMIFLSSAEGSSDISRLVQRWLVELPSDKRLTMASWIDDYFDRAIRYVLSLDLIVDTSLVGLVMNGLCQIKFAKSKQEFICQLIHGLGGNLGITQRVSFAKELLQWSNERPPDMNNPLDCYADGASLRQLVLELPSNKESKLSESINDDFLVRTASVQRVLRTLEPLITNMDPFILIGPEGCGKSLVIREALKQKRQGHGVSMTTVHCNAQTTAEDIITKINQTCSLYSVPEGREYRPREGDRLVLFLKDINLPRPDKYETSQLIAFLQQLLSYDGFYDESLEFLKLDRHRIQIVASMNAATTIGRHTLSSRFTAIVRIYVMDYPEEHELVAICDNYLSVVLAGTNLADRKWLQPAEREKLASAIVEVYQKTREKFTVDDNRHYLFTLRDITTLVSNLRRYDLAAENLLDTIIHEAYRIFCDRLVDTSSKNKFDQIISGVFRIQFRHNSTSSGMYFTSLTKTVSSGVSAATNMDSRDAGVSQKSGRPLQRQSEDDFRKVVEQGLLYYAREERELDMPLVAEILEQVSCVDRVLSGDGGHCLLVGRCGVGRKNATTIASYMLGYHLKTLAVSRGYGTKQFSAEIKAALLIAGVKGEHVVILLEDHQITSESILEMINSLLSAGEIPGLYSHDELEPLLSPLRDVMRDENSNADIRRNITMYEFFVSRVQKYLHIVLSMDLCHSKFLYRCESNPALYSHCTVVWMGEWRSTTLQAVPLLTEGVKDLLNDPTIIDENYNDMKSGESKCQDPKAVSGEKLLDMIVAIHKSAVTHLGSTPKEFTSFLRLWHSLCTSRQAQLETEVAHLEAGLEKLESAAAVVNDLRTNAEQQRKDLRSAQQAADNAMQDITKALISASDRKNEVAEVRRVVAENEKTTQQRKHAIEDELAEIEPLLDQAKQAVGSIKPEHLDEIKRLGTPPEAIADVLAAVLMLLGNQDLSWQSMKRFLGNRGVKEEIMNYDATKMSDEVRRNVAKLMKKKASSFEDAVIARASQAAAPMAKWVTSQIKYSIVVEKIEPLRIELEKETLQLDESTRRLTRCEEELAEIDARVAQLTAEFGSRTAEAERLKRNLEIAGTTLEKAEDLIGQLGGEQVRWRRQVQTLSEDLTKLPLKMLLAAGFASYLPKTIEDTRQELLSQWLQITSQPATSFDFRKALSTESELLSWKAMGLPSDCLSQENGLAINSAVDRVPFVIDPASAATEWLQAMLSKDHSRPLEVVSQYDPRFASQVELAVRFGKTLLVVEADGLEPMFYPLCRKDLTHQGARLCVQVGDKMVDYNEKFRLVLVTRNPQPDLPADAASLVLQVNFTVTRSGLEGQLLGVAIQHEQPELERAKGEMLLKEESFQAQLTELERGLLQALATAQGSLLENTPLIESLARTKEKSVEIEAALKLSADASVQLNQQREVYRPLAQQGAKLYFLLKELKKINNMYQYSLAEFIKIFKGTLDSGSKQSDISEKLRALSVSLETSTVEYCGRGLFKADRYTFTLHMLRRLHPELFQLKEWEIFTGQLVSTISSETSQKPIPGFPDWAPSDRQTAFHLLQETLPLLVQSLDLDSAKWLRFADSIEAEKDVPPIRGVTAFQRVLIVQALRPDRLTSALTAFCLESLHVSSISPPALSMAALLEESDAVTPILLVSSPGADPSKELQEFAERRVGAGNYEELSMGGGMMATALNLLASAATTGGWVCLKNLHLVVAWLPELEKALLSLQSTSHQSLKATYEAPPGVKMNLQRTLGTWDNDMFSSESFGSHAAAGSPIKARLLFLLACFHAVVQERRTFQPQGWTKFYEFSDGDLRAGVCVIEGAIAMTQRGGSTIDWEAVHGLMEDAIYGGRIENQLDLLVLRAYLRMFFNDSLASDSAGGRDILRGTPVRMPAVPEFESFNKIVTQMQETDSPYLFGLPDNIERSQQRAVSAGIISQLRTLSVPGVQANKFDRDTWRAQLGPYLDLWDLLKGSIPGLIGKSKENKDANSTADLSRDGQSPVDDFVALENDLATELCTTVESALGALKKGLFGSGLLTQAVQQIAISLLQHSVPSEWTQRWDTGPEKPQIWLKELVRKRASLVKWNTAAVKGTLLSTPVCLGDLFNPSTFINALRQQSARSLGVAIDRMKLVSAWGGERVSCPHPCMITGMFIQGANMKNNGFLQDSSPKASELMSAANLTIGYIDSLNESSTPKTISVTDVPIFASSLREEYLISVEVPFETESRSRGNGGRGSSLEADVHSELQAKWIVAGVALFLHEGE